MVCRTPGRPAREGPRCGTSTGRWSIPTRLRAASAIRSAVRIMPYCADSQSELTLVRRCAYRKHSCVCGTGSSRTETGTITVGVRTSGELPGSSRFRVTIEPAQFSGTVRADGGVVTKSGGSRDSRHPTARLANSMPRDRGFRADRHDLISVGARWCDLTSYAADPGLHEHVMSSRRNVAQRTVWSGLVRRVCGAGHLELRRIPGAAHPIRRSMCRPCCGRWIPPCSRATGRCSRSRTICSFWTTCSRSHDRHRDIHRPGDVRGVLAHAAGDLRGRLGVRARAACDRVGAAALVIAMSIRHRVPKTGVNTLEHYFHPRMLAFAAGTAALAALLKRRTWAASRSWSLLGRSTQRRASGSASWLAWVR